LRLASGTRTPDERHDRDDKRKHGPRKPDSRQSEQDPYVPEDGRFCLLSLLSYNMRLESERQKQRSENRLTRRERIFTSAQRDARYILRMVPKRIIYIIPYARLINALIRDQSAAVRVNGSAAASGI
jgi:hypothetical protein